MEEGKKKKKKVGGEEEKTDEGHCLQVWGVICEGFSAF